MQNQTLISYYSFDQDDSDVVDGKSQETVTNA